MNKNKDKDKKMIEEQKDIFEDITQYGEFIPTFFTWDTLKQQKEKAKEMENMTKKY